MKGGEAASSEEYSLLRSHLVPLHRAEVLSDNSNLSMAANQGIVEAQKTMLKHEEIRMFS